MKTTFLMNCPLNTMFCCDSIIRHLHLNANAVDPNCCNNCEKSNRRTTHNNWKQTNQQKQMKKKTNYVNLYGNVIFDDFSQTLQWYQSIERNSLIQNFWFIHQSTIRIHRFFGNRNNNSHNNKIRSTLRSLHGLCNWFWVICFVWQKPATQLSLHVCLCADLIVASNVWQITL